MKKELNMGRLFISLNYRFQKTLLDICARVESTTKKVCERESRLSTEYRSRQTALPSALPFSLAKTEKFPGLSIRNRSESRLPTRQRLDSHSYIFKRRPPAHLDSNCHDISTSPHSTPSKCRRCHRCHSGKRHEGQQKHSDQTTNEGAWYTLLDRPHEK